MTLIRTELSAKTGDPSTGLWRPAGPEDGTSRAKLTDLTASDAERFLHDLGKVLSKRSIVMIKSTLRRSIRRAQVRDLIGRNVAELADLPEGQPGRPSRAMTEDQAAKALKAAAGKPIAYIKVVKIGHYRKAVAHAATDTGNLACRAVSRQKAASNSSNEPASARAGQVLTSAPMEPWPRPCARLAPTVAGMPAPKQQCANVGTRLLRRRRV
jgi:hypothetical protein